MGIRKAHIELLYFISFTAVLILLPWWTRLSTYALVILVITGLLTTSWKFKLSQIRQRPQVLVFPLFYLIYLIGLLYTPNLREGLRSVDQKLVLFLIPLLTISSIPFSDKQRKSVLMLFAYSNILLTIVCVIINLSLAFGEPHPQVNFDFHTLARFVQLHGESSPLWMQFSYVAFSYFFIAPTYFSIYLVLCILILAYHPTTGKVTYLKYAAMGWLIVVIILLSSRMGILLLLGVGALNMAFWLYQKKFPVLQSVLSAVFVCMVCSMIWIFPVTRFRVIEEPFATPLAIPSDYKQWNSMNLRILEWQSGLSGIKEYGISGTGTGGSLDVLHSRYDQYPLGDLDEKYNAHNQYIETYLEIGLPGFIGFIGCLLIPLYHGIKKREGLMLSIVLMVMIGCLTTSMFEKSRGLVFYIALISMFMFTKNNDDEPAEGK